MGTITGTDVVGTHENDSGARSRIITWEAMGDDDTGTSIEVYSYPDKTIQFSGTWGGATVILQGSQDGTTWKTLVDSSGIALSFTVDSDIKLIRDNPRFLRASSSGGSGTDVDVIITAVK